MTCDVCHGHRLHKIIELGNRYDPHRMNKAYKRLEKAGFL